MRASFRNAWVHVPIPKRRLLSCSGFRFPIVWCWLGNHGEPPYKTYPNVFGREVASGDTKCLLRRFLPYRQNTDFFMLGASGPRQQLRKLLSRTRRNRRACAGPLHCPSSALVQSGAAWLITFVVDSGPTYRPSTNAADRPFIRKASPTATTRQHCQVGKRRPRWSRSSASPARVPLTVTTSPVRQTVCPGRARVGSLIRRHSVPGCTDTSRFDSVEALRLKPFRLYVQRPRMAEWPNFRIY